VDIPRLKQVIKSHQHLYAFAMPVSTRTISHIL
jgi:hypothetical protein